MPEVYASNEVTAELLDPVSGSVITAVSIPFRRDLTISERPVYAQRGYHRSNTLSAGHLRSLGSVTLRKDADSLALAAEIKRWQKGVTFYALSSDLKGKRYRHPHLRVTFTNADGSTDVATAYNVKLSDRSLSAPDGGIVGDSISLDVLGGFEPKEGGYEPVRALDFARTGSATYLSTAGTLTTAGDGVARITADGLLLEGASDNILSSNQATAGDTLGDTTGFSASDGWYLGATGSISVDTDAFQGSKSIKFQGSGGPEGVCTTGVSADANSTYTAQLRIKGEAGKTYSYFISDNTNSVRQIVVGFTATGDWEFKSISLTTGANPVTELLCGVRADTAGAIIKIDALKIEKSPFPTSWNDGARLADLLGIVPPHNLIDYSEFQLGFVSPWGSGNFYNDTFPAWVSDATGGPSGKPAAKVVIPGGGNGFAPTAIRPITLEAGVVYTISVKAHLSATGTLRLGFDGTNDGGSYANEGDTPVPANTWVRVKATLTASAAQQYIKVLPKIPGGGTVTITEVQITRGSHPGPYVKTTDTPIPAPVSPALDPAWSQNGAIEFDVLPPPATTGMLYCLFGAQGSTGNEVLRLFREGGTSAASHSVSFDRKHNGTSGSSGVAGRGRVVSTATLYDGAKHRIRLEWLNYTLNGVRSMIQRVYVDGVLAASQDVAALYGATEWATPSASVLVSDGGTIYTTLSNLELEYPTLPAGAVPAL